MIPAELAPSARSAYRSVLRAARQTFHGDPPRHVALVTALRATFESPTLTAPENTVAHSKPKPVRRSMLRKQEEAPAVDPASTEELSKRIQEWKDVAEFLRKNVVQGRLDEQSGTYSEYAQVEELAFRGSCDTFPSVRGPEEGWAYGWVRF